MKEGRRLRTFLLFLLLVLFWGTAFAAIKLGLHHCPPLLFAGLRSLLGGVVMVPVAFARDGAPDLKRNWPVFGFLALLNVVLFFGLQTYAVLLLPSGSAALLVYLQPMLVGLLAWPLLGERLSGSGVAGLLLGFAGITVVSAGSLLGELRGLSPAGVALGAASALAWASGTVYFKIVQESVSTLWSVAVQFVVGGMLLTAAGAFVEGLEEVGWGAVLFWCYLLYAALVGVSFAWIIWFSLVRAGEASRVSAYIFAVPLTAVAVGVVFLGEPFGPGLLVGAALVVAGIYLVNRSGRVAA
ncbi:putative amino-acid metabolite efflux pump [Rubrobacter xylanophilus DSM 9941]|uniref:DMT family transporter n=1 Tax=Rubrobacter xylanophilus TaxID=49319 RepID=UPI001C63FDB2|nr:DMT family transporter [Rubrobacter xylanophilus]QYJ14236.1 putative amino-acid metabolite efflux pump [Rubrobacter xylanophilus DSM 9941]